jgi:hypothetical protein
MDADNIDLGLQFDEVRILGTDGSIVDAALSGYEKNGIAYDPDDRTIFVTDEFGKGVTIIDGEADRKINRVELGGLIGNVQYDPITKLWVSRIDCDPHPIDVRARNCARLNSVFLDLRAAVDGVEALIVEPVDLRPDRHIALQREERVRGKRRCRERRHRSHASARNHQSSKQGAPHAGGLWTHHG